MFKTLRDINTFVVDTRLAPTIEYKKFHKQQ